MVRRKLAIIFMVVLFFATVASAGTTPSKVPVGRDGKPVALLYYQKSNDMATPLRFYEEQTLRASAALIGATGRSNSTAVTGIGHYTKAFIYLDVTAMTRPDADETLDVVVETSHDAGTTWLRIARFTTVVAAGAATQLLIFAENIDVTPIANPDDTDPASGAISTGMFGDQIRVACTYTDAANADGTSTFSVKAFFKR